VFSRLFGAMKIFVAGATGAVGRRLVPLLTAAGHEVAGLTRSPAKASLLRSMGATPVIADALDRAAVMNVVQREKPEIVVHELTSIKDVDMRNFDQGFAETNRLRTEGTDNLLAAARAAGVTPVYRTKLCGLALRAGGRTGQDRGGPARSKPAAVLSPHA
jgi:nucleoside-diphosphate-sugar epimerase